MDNWLTTSEAADDLGVTRPRVLQFIYAGRLPATRRGHQWMIHRKDLAEFAAIERKTGQPGHQ